MPMYIRIVGVFQSDVTVRKAHDFLSPKNVTFCIRLLRRFLCMFVTETVDGILNRNTQQQKIFFCDTLVGSKYSLVGFTLRGIAYMENFVYVRATEQEETQDEYNRRTLNQQWM